MTHFAHNSKENKNAPLEKVGSDSVAGGVEGNGSGTGVAVKLIVHLDFEAHLLFKRDILFSDKNVGTFDKNMATEGERKEHLLPLVIRSSSVSGMEHFTFVLA
jgi:hypothetical protein